MANPLQTGLSACALAVALCLAGVAVAQDAIGRVIRYRVAEVRLYDETGRPTGERRAASQLPAGADILEARSGGLIAIRTAAGPVYLRGIDVEFQLNNAVGEVCRPVVVPGRGAGTVTAGTNAGGGSSRDCQRAVP